MNTVKSYLNFDLLLDDLGDGKGYEVRVIDSPSGQAKQDFTLPFSSLELENFILKLGQGRGVRSIDADVSDISSARNWGAKLYDCLFKDEVSELFSSSLAVARHQNKGLRIRLRLSDAPELINVPWELLYDKDLKNFVSLSINTPIVRKLDFASLPKVQEIEKNIHVLVMISSPEGHYKLDVEREWEFINEATKNLQKKGKIKLTRIEPSLKVLQKTLRRDTFHVFHYIGHGGFNEANMDGYLALQSNEGKAHLVSGQYLGSILQDELTIHLALLNSCRGSRTSARDPFAGVGQGLLQKGIPHVIAMQFVSAVKSTRYQSLE